MEQCTLMSSNIKISEINLGGLKFLAYTLYIYIS